MKKKDREDATKISKRLLGILKAHKRGESVIREMAERIAARKRARDTL